MAPVQPQKWATSQQRQQNSFGVGNWSLSMAAGTESWAPAAASALQTHLAPCPKQTVITKHHPSDMLWPPRSESWARQLRQHFKFKFQCDVLAQMPEVILSRSDIYLSLQHGKRVIQILLVHNSSSHRSTNGQYFNDKAVFLVAQRFVTLGNALIYYWHRRRSPTQMITSTSYL